MYPDTEYLARRKPAGAPTGMSRYHALVAMGALPLLILAVFAYLISDRAVDRLVRASNDATAVITAEMAKREAEYWRATLVSHAGFPVLSAAVAAGNVLQVRRRLEIMVNAHPRLDRAFVTDKDGLLWTDYPVAPESLGRNFADRDWYRGVTRDGTPYISEVYRRNAEPQLQVVAVAAPVLDPGSGEIAGYLVVQVRLAELSELLRQARIGAKGMVMLLDHTGALAAHPLLDVESRLHREYAKVALPLLEQAEAGTHRIEYLDPVTDEEVLASVVSARVLGHTWTVISQQPISTAFAANRTLAWQLTAAGFLMALLVASLVWGLGRENAQRRRAEDELTALNQELERRVEERTLALRRKEEEFLQAQKMEAVGQLAGGIAHDFNNLLTVILGSTELWLVRTSKEDSGRQEIQDAHDAAESAAALTRQLLAFSRNQVMQPQTLDLNAVLERMRSILDRVLGANVDLVWQLSPGLYPVKFDPGQIEQVVMNLVVNACDAMPDGGELTIATCNVELGDEFVARHPDARAGPHAVLAVSDTGTGMDSEVINKIFEPFYTTKQLGRGTGLGLSTVYGIVRQGGGNIQVDSKPGQGATFRIYLPRTSDTPVPDKAATEPGRAGDTGTLLVVDDEAGVRELLERVLRSAGYTVITASDADGARAAFREHGQPLDLLLTDVVLPGTNGPGLAAELKREQPGLQVLYMSGYADDGIVQRGILDQGTAFIEKPFRPQAVVDKVREILEAARR